MRKLNLAVPEYVVHLSLLQDMGWKARGVANARMGLASLSRARTQRFMIQSVNTKGSQVE